jgi:hypothetical protein
MLTDKLKLTEVFILQNARVSFRLQCTSLKERTFISVSNDIL